MKATILVDGVEYTGELVEKKGKFRAKYDDRYWYIDSDGNVHYSTETNHSSDDFSHLTGNYFATEKEAKEYKTYLEALGHVTHAVYALNDGWEPDWSDTNQKKWYVCFENGENIWNVTATNYYQYPYIIPILKTEELTKKLIKDHLTDLEVIRKYKV